MILPLVIALSALAQTKVTEESLSRCYESHPFFQEAIMGISDDDFANKTKSGQRKKSIQAEYSKNSSSVRTCLDHVIQFAKDQKDPANLKYVILRTGEISSVVNAVGAVAPTSPTK